MTPASVFLRTTFPGHLNPTPHARLPVHDTPHVLHALRHLMGTAGSQYCLGHGDPHTPATQKTQIIITLDNITRRIYNMFCPFYLHMKGKEVKEKKKEEEKKDIQKSAESTGPTK